MSTRNHSARTSLPSVPADFSIENYSSVFLIRCETERGRQFLLNSVALEAQWFGDTLAVEPRFIGGLISALRENGWEVA